MKSIFFTSEIDLYSIIFNDRTSPVKRRISLENGTPAKKLKMKDSESESGEALFILLLA